MFTPLRNLMCRLGRVAASFIVLLCALAALLPPGAAFAAPADAAAKPLTVIFFGCQEGYLKPCG